MDQFSAAIKGNMGLGTILPKVRLDQIDQSDRRECELTIKMMPIS